MSWGHHHSVLDYLSSDFGVEVVGVLGGLELMGLFRKLVSGVTRVCNISASGVGAVPSNSAKIESHLL
jgi:hypothetical protein